METIESINDRLVYLKLSKARMMFRQVKIKKTGYNAFAKYAYFELEDFLNPIMDIFNEVKLIGVVSFDADDAVLAIIDLEDGGRIEFTAPMMMADIKGCSPVQNLGGAITYLRRYLWINAFEILEHDVSEAVTKKKEGAIITPARPEITLDDKRQSLIVDVSLAIKERFDADDLIGAYGEFIEIVDGDEKTVLWGLIPAHIRAKLKEHDKTLKGT